MDLLRFLTYRLLHRLMVEDESSRCYSTLLFFIENAILLLIYFIDIVFRLELGVQFYVVILLSLALVILPFILFDRKDNMKIERIVLTKYSSKKIRQFSIIFRVIFAVVFVMDLIVIIRMIIVREGL